VSAGGRTEPLHSRVLLCTRGIHIATTAVTGARRVADVVMRTDTIFTYGSEIGGGAVV